MNQDAVILAALDKVHNEAANLIQLASGIVLRIKPVASAVVSRGLRASPEPEPPRVLIDDQDTWEINTADPDYLMAIDAWGMARLKSAYRVYLGLGTEYVSGGIPPSSNEWAELLSAVGINISANPAVRYVEWVTLYALTDIVEMTNVCLQIMRKSGTLEADVLEAVHWFRDREIRTADNRAVHSQHNQDRNNVSSIGLRNGAGVRGQRSSDIQRIYMAGVAANRAG